MAGVALGDMDRPPLSFLPSPSQLLHAHTHTRTHTQLITTHNLSPYTTYHHTTYSHLLFHTQLAPHQSFTISFLSPAFPMPSLLYLSFAACWKKLTCGVIRSFSFAFAFCSDPYRDTREVTDPQTYKIQVLFM